MVQLIAKYFCLLIILQLTYTYADKLNLEIRSCRALEIIVTGQSSCEDLYIYQINKTTNQNIMEFYYSSDKNQSNLTYNFSELIDRYKSNCSHISFRNPEHNIKEIDLLIEMSLTFNILKETVKIGYNYESKCWFKDVPYVEIKITGCDILNFKMTHPFIKIDEIIIYEKIGLQNLIYYYRSNNIIRQKSKLGLLITALNVFAVKLSIQKLHVVEFPLSFQLIPTTGDIFQNETCLLYELSTKCFKSGSVCKQNAVKKIILIPAIPKDGDPLCIQVNYTVQTYYFIDKLILHARNLSDEVKTNIYTFTKSSAEDDGKGTFSDDHYWTLRINMSINTPNDTVCFLKIQQSDENMEFSWNLRFQNKDDKYDKKNVIHNFNIKVSKNDIAEDKPTIATEKNQITIIASTVSIVIVFLVILIVALVIIKRRRRKASARKDRKDKPLKTNEIQADSELQQINTSGYVFVPSEAN